MGKRLVIKDADFSANAVDVRIIEWYILSYTNYDGSESHSIANVVNGGWAFVQTTNALIQGKTINALRFKAAGNGALNIYKGTLNSTSKTLIGTVNISSSEAGQEVTKTFTPYTMGANDFLIIGEPNSAGAFYYRGNISPTGVSHNFYTKVPSEWSLTTANNLELCFDVGYIEPE